ncbi:MAG TPA: hypothetical protein VJ306_16905, partial [Pyrinomonadaceae bacterium]|nr:hypothetical protein [Pyrinomonadaceae bacterium]
MKKLMRALVGVCLLSLASSTVVHSQSLAPKKVNQVVQQKQGGGTLSEEFSFLIKDFKIDHQGENNTLNISITYRYVVNIANSDYPDFRWLAKDVETLLGNYPNKTDYWEIVNKQITSLLMKKYPALASVTCEITVAPSAN